MAYEDLILAVEVSARERVQELQERSKKEADGIIKDAQAKDGPIRKRHLERAIEEADLRKNRLISSVREENRLKLLELKNQIFNTAFEGAGQNLARIRESPQYRGSLKILMEEVFRELGTNGVVLHIDPRDSALSGELLAGLGVPCEVVTDISCAGGLDAHTKDERFMVFNTLEARLKQAGGIYRPDIFSLLFG